MARAPGRVDCTLPIHARYEETPVIKNGKTLWWKALFCRYTHIDEVMEDASNRPIKPSISYSLIFLLIILPKNQQKPTMLENLFYPFSRLFFPFLPIFLSPLQSPHFRFFFLLFGWEAILKIFDIKYERLNSRWEYIRV